MLFIDINLQLSQMRAQYLEQSISRRTTLIDNLFTNEGQQPLAGSIRNERDLS